MSPRVRYVCARACLAAWSASLIAHPLVEAAAESKAGARPAARTQRSTSPPPQIALESLPALLQRAAQAFAAGDFAQAASAFGSVESGFGTEAAWLSGTLPRKVLPLRGFAALRAGRPAEAADDLAAFLERFPDEIGQRSFALYALALALQQAGKPEEALARFEQFESEHAGSAQAALARLQRAEICFALGRHDDGFALLQTMRADAAVAETLRVQARLRALEKAVDQRRDDLALALLFDEPWTVATMPEIAVLGFAAMETGDRLLAAGRPDEAVRAFRLVPPKRQLVAAQRARLDELKQLFEARAPGITSGSGLFWVDFYQARINRLEGQLSALEAAEDYSWSLRLRLGQAWLLAHRGHEAWLCFESVGIAEAAPQELRRDAHYRWILAAAELDHWEDALVIARAFLDRYPDSPLAPETFFLIARAHLEQQRFEDAETVLSDIIERFPTHPASLRSRFTRGWVRTMRENYAAARDDFTACIAAAPQGPLAVQAGLWRGLTHHFAREHPAALEAFDALIAAHPDDAMLPEIRYRRAATLYAMRDLDRARVDMEHFVSTYPMHARHAEALVLLGDIHMGSGALAEALARFGEVPADAVDSHVYATFQIGKILRAQNEFEALARHMTRYAEEAAVRRLPRVSEALHLIGWAEEQLGRPEAALPRYADALTRFGNDPAASEVSATLHALARLVRRLDAPSGDALAAYPALQPLLSGGFEPWLRAERDRALAAQHATYHARLTLALADLHLARREPAQAELLLLDLAGSTAPEAMDAAALARVGSTLQAIGSEDALALFQRLLRVYPRSAERGVALHGLARHAAEGRRHGEALAWIRRFEAETPAHALHPDVALLAGRVFEESGQHREATRRYESVLGLKAARGRKHALALAGLGRCARHAGEPERAIAFYQRIYTLHRAQADLAADAYLESAPLFEQLGDTSAAAATYREMLALADIGDPAQRERAAAALEQIETRAEAEQAQAAGGSRT